MIALMTSPMFAAAGYAMLYLLVGGGFGVAILIFIVAKMMGKRVGRPLVKVSIRERFQANLDL